MGGATTTAFATTNQLNWLSVVPNLSLVIIELMYNDPAQSIPLATSISNLQATIAYVQSLSGSIPILVIISEPAYTDVGQGALVAAEKQLAVANGYDYFSIYDLFGSFASAFAQGLYYSADSPNYVHPNQTGHNLIASSLYNWLMPPQQSFDQGVYATGTGSPGFHAGNVGTTAVFDGYRWGGITAKNLSNSNTTYYSETGMYDQASGSTQTFLVNAAHNGWSIDGGTNLVYRCTTAGTLPVGALTTVTANCGASTGVALLVP